MTRTADSDCGPEGRSVPLINLYQPRVSDLRDGKVVELCHARTRCLLVGLHDEANVARRERPVPVGRLDSLLPVVASRLWWKSETDAGSGTDVMRWL
jgi:hypothetical protein